MRIHGKDLLFKTLIYFESRTKPINIQCPGKIYDYKTLKQVVYTVVPRKVDEKSSFNVKIEIKIINSI